MKKIATIGFILVFCLLIAACSTNNDIAPVEPEPTADVGDLFANLPLFVDVHEELLRGRYLDECIEDIS